MGSSNPSSTEDHHQMKPTQKQSTSANIMALTEQHSAHNYHPVPVVISRGEGIYVWDPEGHRYYDFLSAYSAVNQGHCHPKIVQCMMSQATQLTLTSRAFYNDKFGMFSEYITNFFKYDMVLPMNTGAEAIDTAVKLARKWGYMKKGIPANKAIVLSCSGNFHGRTMTAVSLSVEKSSREGFGPFLPNVGVECPSTHERIIFNQPETLERALCAHGDCIAAFIVEPIQGEAGVVIPDEGYLRKCYELCQKYRVLFIADEIQSGLGRTGAMLACDHDHVRPDVLLLGKALSGGTMPISCVLADRDIMLCIQPGEHGSTFGGNPLASAVAMTALQVIKDEKLVENSARLGRLLLKGLQSIQSPLIECVRGKGLFCAIVINDKDVTAWDVCLLLKSRGLLAKPTRRNIIRLAPPLVITEQQLMECLQIMVGAFKDIVNMKVSEIPGYVPEK